MAGFQSWIETYSNVPTPCAPGTQTSTLSSCVLWLMLGLLLGGLKFQKSGPQ